MNTSEAIVWKALAQFESDDPTETELARQFAKELSDGELRLVVVTRVLGGIQRLESHAHHGAPPNRFDVV